MTTRKAVKLNWYAVQDGDDEWYGVLAPEGSDMGIVSSYRQIPRHVEPAWSSDRGFDSPQAVAEGIQYMLYHLRDGRVRS